MPLLRKGRRITPPIRQAFLQVEKTTTNESFELALIEKEGGLALIKKEDYKSERRSIQQRIKDKSSSWGFGDDQTARGPLIRGLLSLWSCFEEACHEQTSSTNKQTASTNNKKKNTQIFLLRNRLRLRQKPLVDQNDESTRQSLSSGSSVGSENTIEETTRRTNTTRKKNLRRSILQRSNLDKDNEIAESSILTTSTATTIAVDNRTRSSHKVSSAPKSGNSSNTITFKSALGELCELPL